MWLRTLRTCPSAGLCSIEALYFLLRQLQENDGLADKFREPHYFDNLLWFFALQHEVVSNQFESRKKKQRQG
jgi:hypothetical protein